MNNPTPPQAPVRSASQARAEPMPVDKYSEYLLRARSEILHVLRGLAEHNALITAHFNGGADFIITSLIEATESGLLLDVGTNAELNRKAAASGKLVCVTSLDKVRIQFSLPELKPVEHQGRPAFRAPFPETLLRLQRREYYRLTTPVANPIRCQVIVDQPDGGKTTVITQLSDISGGGVALTFPPNSVNIVPEMDLSNCRLELPEVGVIVGNLKVRNVFEITLRSGIRVLRAGCQFVRLPGPMLTLVQRYIIKVERERKARESGLV